MNRWTQRIGRLLGEHFAIIYDIATNNDKFHVVKNDEYGQFQIVLSFM